MPSIATVMRWLSEDEAWQEQYARARKAGDDAMAEDIQDIADSPEYKPEDKRVMIDARKWLLGKRQPKKYGERQLIGSDPENPLPPGASISITATPAEAAEAYRLMITGK